MLKFQGHHPAYCWWCLARKNLWYLIVGLGQTNKKTCFFFGGGGPTVDRRWLWAKREMVVLAACDTSCFCSSSLYNKILLCVCS
jgi:hypothetical protein